MLNREKVEEGDGDARGKEGGSRWKAGREISEKGKEEGEGHEERRGQEVVRVQKSRC